MSFYDFLEKPLFHATTYLPEGAARRVEHIQGKDHDSWPFPATRGTPTSSNVELARVPVPEKPGKPAKFPLLSLLIDANVRDQEQLLAVLERHTNNAAFANGAHFVVGEMEHSAESHNSAEIIIPTIVIPIYNFLCYKGG